MEEAFSGTKRRVTINEGGRPRQVDVQIPAGIGDGQALRIGGAPGARRSSSASRCARILCTLLNGKDVQIELPLAPWEAALGAKVAVPTLGGTVELTIPPGAQTGQKLRLRGRGMPGSPSGDQIVIIKLVTPAAETAAGPRGLRAHEARAAFRSARRLALSVGPRRSGLKSAARPHASALMTRPGQNTRHLRP